LKSRDIRYYKRDAPLTYIIYVGNQKLLELPLPEGSVLGISASGSHVLVEKPEHFALRTGLDLVAYQRDFVDLAWSQVKEDRDGERDYSQRQSGV
jgi:hypothetical protein